MAPTCNHQEDGAQHEATDPQGFGVEAFNEQRAQGTAVPKDDDQRHGCRFPGCWHHPGVSQGLLCKIPLKLSFMIIW